ncbi:hypothetical protein [Lachnotalea sp. AF33-28]|uniref:hypothetical protein n=1 Tax=Lachnotalea sp. AF33-28 TaxID=2292046 RepID=UPI00131451A3|nr:hypothetical protein [Lachnotalea sp. AF33-28]
MKCVLTGAKKYPGSIRRWNPVGHHIRRHIRAGHRTMHMGSQAGDPAHDMDDEFQPQPMQTIT